MINSDNHLFELARSGQRLTNVVLAIVLSIGFVIAAQLVGGIPAVMLVLPLKMAAGNAMPSDPDAMVAWLMPDSALQQTIFLVLSFGPIFLLLWGWLAAYEKRPFWTVGLERRHAGLGYLRGLVVGLVMFSLSIAISGVLGFVAVEESTVQPVGLAAIGGVLLVLLGWIVQGAAEEVITRGWLLPVIGARYWPVLGIVLSSLLFMALHSCNPNPNPIAFLNLFLFGLFAALYALYEGGLWGVFSLHSVWNWAQGNLFGFEVSGNPAAGGTLFNLMEVGPDVITGGPFGPEGGLAVTLVLVIGCLAVWRLGSKLSLQPS